MSSIIRQGQRQTLRELDREERPLIQCVVLSAARGMPLFKALWEDGVAIQDNAISFCRAFPMSYALVTSETRHVQPCASPIYINNNIYQHPIYV